MEAVLSFHVALYETYDCNTGSAGSLVNVARKLLLLRDPHYGVCVCVCVCASVCVAAECKCG